MTDSWEPNPWPGRAWSSIGWFLALAVGGGARYGALTVVSSFRHPDSFEDAFGVAIQGLFILMATGAALLIFSIYIALNVHHAFDDPEHRLALRAVVSSTLAMFLPALMLALCYSDVQQAPLVIMIDVAAWLLTAAAMWGAALAVAALRRRRSRARRSGAFENLARLDDD